VLGFDDSAFGPADDWRVMGDVQQWHKALLVKDKVGTLIHVQEDSHVLTVSMAVLLVRSSSWAHPVQHVPWQVQVQCTTLCSPYCTIISLHTAHYCPAGGRQQLPLGLFLHCGLSSPPLRLVDSLSGRCGGEMWR
jgi:hypothetical protein